MEVVCIILGLIVYFCISVFIICIPFFISEYFEGRQREKCYLVWKATMIKYLEERSK